jgi:hypothetical protein
MGWASRRVCEKIAQNAAKNIFCQNLKIELLPYTKVLNFLATFWLKEHLKVQNRSTGENSATLVTLLMGREIESRQDFTILYYLTLKLYYLTSGIARPRPVSSAKSKSSTPDPISSICRNLPDPSRTKPVLSAASFPDDDPVTILKSYKYCFTNICNYKYL